MKTKEENYYQPLFDLMQNHNLTLLDDELSEIVQVVKTMLKPTPPIDVEKLAAISREEIDNFFDIYENLKVKYANSNMLPSEYGNERMVLINNLLNKCADLNAGKEWIELKKETPKIHSENYLVYKNREIKVSLFRGDWNMFHCDIYRSIDEPFVTHWMPLPNKPSNH